MDAKRPFKEHQDFFLGLEHIYVFSDALILDDFGNNIRGLDAEHNYLVNQLLFKKIRYYLAETLDAKFHLAHSSIGMHLAGNVYVTDTYNKNNQIYLPLISENDTPNHPVEVIESTFEQILFRTDKRRINKPFQKRFINHKFKNIESLGLKEKEAALFFLIEGAKVPDKKRGSKTALSLFLSLGNFIAIELSVYRTYMVVVNHEGAVKWASVAGKPGNILEDDDQTSTIWASFKRFPVRIKNRKVR
ncbi:hypothetical protein [Marinicella marina]|uniref:hypothetical protein n=1 Tax=Marinicella marina TaxID=2996016 RepID=UPI0024BD30C7|nr:hypothetical protein [Marinicella marina]